MTYLLFCPCLISWVLLRHQLVLSGHLPLGNGVIDISGRYIARTDTLGCFRRSDSLLSRARPPSKVCLRQFITEEHREKYLGKYRQNQHVTYQSVRLMRQIFQIKDSLAQKIHLAPTSTPTNLSHWWIHPPSLWGSAPIPCWIGIFRPRQPSPFHFPSLRTAFLAFRFSTIFRPTKTQCCHVG